MKKEQDSTRPAAILALLEPTRVPMVKITLSQESDPTALSSHVQGMPYFEETSDSQKTLNTLNNHKLFLQLNFSEVPFFDPDLPTEGIFQIYFSMANNSNYGIIFDKDSAPGYQTLYWPKPDITKHSQELSEPLTFINNNKDQAYFPGQTCSMHFEASTQLHNPFDEVGNKKFNSIVTQIQKSDDDSDIWCDISIQQPAHQIGGYAYFTQYDPRPDVDSEWILLIQIDTDDDVDLMWGDAGIGNIFIRRSDLKELRFDKCLFSWDCC